MKTKFSTLLGSALLVTGLASTIIAAPAEAASVSCTSGKVSLGGVSATTCAGAFDGNDTGNKGTLEAKLDGGLFKDIVGTGDWSLVGKSDESSVVNAANGSTKGAWSLDNALSSNTFVLSLKSSTHHSAYLFKNYDWSKGLSGAFEMAGVSVNNRGNAQALSHASVFTFKPNVVTPPPDKKIPEPATMMGLGVVASAMLIRRRKSN